MKKYAKLYYKIEDYKKVIVLSEFKINPLFFQPGIETA